MVDSCFKVFRVKCFRKSSVKTNRESRESIFQSDKNAINDNVLHDKKNHFDRSTTSIDSDKKVNYERSINDFEYGLEMEPDVVLRRQNRPYLRSISTTTSNDAMSSDEDDNENLDILYPLPRVNTHERSLIEEANRQTVDKNNGTEERLTYSCILMTREYQILDKEHAYASITLSSFAKNNFPFSFSTHPNRITNR